MWQAPPSWKGRSGGMAGLALTTRSLKVAGPSLLKGRAREGFIPVSERSLLKQQYLFWTDVGGDLQIIATFPDGSVQISQFENIAMKTEKGNSSNSG